MNAGQFQPGHEKIAGSGRKPGTPNKVPGQIKEALGNAVLDLIPDMVERIRQAPMVPDYSSASFLNRFFELLKVTLPYDGERTFDTPDWSISSDPDLIP